MLYQAHDAYMSFHMGFKEEMDKCDVFQEQLGK
jgi:hypothetical protein